MSGDVMKYCREFLLIFQGQPPCPGAQDPVPLTSKPAETVRPESTDRGVPAAKLQNSEASLWFENDYPPALKKILKTRH